MQVLQVIPAGGMRWQTRAAGHLLSYDQLIAPVTADSCTVTFTATVSGPAAGAVERIAGPLSAFGQRRRLARLDAAATWLASR